MNLPFDQRPSPVGAAGLARTRVRLGEAFAAGSRTYWLQSDPDDPARTTLMTPGPDLSPVDLTPGFDLRCGLHEYGGTPVAVGDNWIAWTDRTTGQLWAARDGATPAAITEPGPWRFGGFSVVDDTTVIAVREDYSARPEPADAVVLLDVGRPNPGGGRIVAQGADFYFSPVVRDGWTAWMEYDHPSMPWGSTRIVALSPDGVRHEVAAAIGVAAVYPQWGADGCLYFLSDESGYWNFCRWDKVVVERLHTDPYDFCSPCWVAAQPPYALLGGPGEPTRIGCSWWQDGWSYLGVLTPGTGLTELAVTAGATVHPGGGTDHRADRPTSSVILPQAGSSAHPTTPARGLVLIATVDAPARLTEIDWETGETTVLATEGESWPGLTVTPPQPIRWPATARSSTGEQATGWFYPAHDTAGTLAPLLVVPHSGPTSQSTPAYNLVTQFFTTRGIAVVEVNYAGSAGRGRAWREALDGAWGLADVADCVGAVNHLVARGLADPARVAIMGSSAGGFTALAAATTTTVFSAAISMYGVADLAGLARDTTKFESRYTGALVGGDNEELYAARSPVHHIDKLSCPVLLLQGELDAVVPLNQATAMFGAARAKGIDAELVVYPGEGHGFRQPATIADAYQQILAFLARVWG